MWVKSRFRIPFFCPLLDNNFLFIKFEKRIFFLKKKPQLLLEVKWVFPYALYDSKVELKLFFIVINLDFVKLKLEARN